MTEEFSHNLAYSPEKVGAELVSVLHDSDACYSFDDLYCFKRLSDGAVFVIEDSGCSYPVALESVDSWDDLRRVESHNFAVTVEQQAMSRRGNQNTLDEVTDFLGKVREALNA